MANLAQLRHERGLSQRQLAAASGVPQNRIADIERGAASILNTRYATIVALADALHISDMRGLWPDSDTPDTPTTTQT